MITGHMTNISHETQVTKEWIPTKGRSTTGDPHPPEHGYTAHRRHKDTGSEPCR